VRIIFLNCYSGQILKPLLDFITEQSLVTDIFCFSEVSVDLQKKFSEVLTNFSTVFEIGGLITDSGKLSGQSTFAKKGLEILSFKKIIIHKIQTDDVGFLLKTTLNINGKLVSIENIHGTKTPTDKKDFDTRLKQSETIIESFKEDKNKIIIGDFNLLRNTKSIQMIENAGYRNLIKDFGVKATRNQVAWNRFENEPGYVKQYDSDYCFVLPNVKIKSFEVPYMEISDHLPLILDFEI